MHGNNRKNEVFIYYIIISFFSLRFVLGTPSHDSYNILDGRTLWEFYFLFYPISGAYIAAAVVVMETDLWPDSKRGLRRYALENLRKRICRVFINVWVCVRSCVCGLYFGKGWSINPTIVYVNGRERAFVDSVYVHDLLGIRNETFLGAPRASEYYISMLRYVIFYPKGWIG